jgi:hypothetical protein
VALQVEVDLRHGGRWTSLRAGDREWLWRRAAPERADVQPGAAFVDAGGLEECLPTLRGRPDHGDVWTRAWTQDGAWQGVRTPDFALRRRLQTGPDRLAVDYELTARPGFRFLWAAHALLDVSPDATLRAEPGLPTRLEPEPPPGAPDLQPATGHGGWPEVGGTALDCLGPDDGTAAVAQLRGCDRMEVVDGADHLELALNCPDQPVSFVLWRNLAGWPPHSPYRSVGVEPALGQALDLAEAGPAEAAVVPAAGLVRWTLTLRAGRQPAS